MVKKVAKVISRDKRIIVISVLIGLVVTFAIGFSSRSYALSVQEGIASNVVRLHVIANSDREDDQRVKLAVRDEIIDMLQPVLDGSEGIEETRKILLRNLPEIKAVAAKTLKDNGFDYGVDVTLAKNVYFPTKSYGDIGLPAGEYEAVQVKLGNATGQNWWCVLFPPLCYVDGTRNVVATETKMQLKKILTEEEYNLVVQAQDSGAVPTYKIKFKIVEWWQERQHKNAVAVSK